MNALSDLSRRLKGRHIQLIALGGTIGVGLFLGSAGAIHTAGPGLLIGYGIGGLAIFFIMRALGELLLYRPVAGSFASYADEFVSPLAGFITGWSYWFMWVVTAMAELTAIGICVHFSLPELPQWLPDLCALALFYGIDTLTVRVYGELEHNASAVLGSPCARHATVAAAGREPIRRRSSEVHAISAAVAST